MIVCWALRPLSTVGAAGPVSYNLWVTTSSRSRAIKPRASANQSTQTDRELPLCTCVSSTSRSQNSAFRPIERLAATASVRSHYALNRAFARIRARACLVWTALNIIHRDNKYNLYTRSPYSKIILLLCASPPGDLDSMSISIMWICLAHGCTKNTERMQTKRSAPDNDVIP